ncbi:hypothetical protein OIO90_006312 [Microbotryomycetes sp. JL221]|nr:hypothetical protein OIO90_006312 [Microbotryomycetes sp. JL221]
MSDLAAEAAQLPSTTPSSSSTTTRATFDMSGQPTTDNRVDQALKHFRQLLTVPNVARATFLATSEQDDARNIVIDTSSRSLTTLSKRSATEVVTLTTPRGDNPPRVIARAPAAPIDSQIKHSSYSPDATLQILFRESTASDSKPAKKVVEIWHVADGRMLEDLDVTDAHGDWYFDSTFGPVSWHPESHAIAYVAEAPKPKKQSDTAWPDPESFRYVPDYGETFTGKRNPCVFLFAASTSPFTKRTLESSSANLGSNDDRSRPSVHRLTDQDTFSLTDFGQPVFLADEASGSPVLLATGYSRLGDHRKLGIVYCQNRPAAIHVLRPKLVSSPGEHREKDTSEIPKTWKVDDTRALTKEDRSARSPRVVPASPSNIKAEHNIVAVFISNASGGPHGSCASLHVIENVNGKLEQRILIDVVQKPKVEDGFPGLYIDQLPNQCFMQVQGRLQLVTSSIWQSRRVALLIGLSGSSSTAVEDGGASRVTCLTPWPKRDPDDIVSPYLSKDLDSYVVLGTDNEDHIIALRSGCCSLPEVVVARLSGQANSTLEWTVVKKIRAAKAGKLVVSVRFETALAGLSATVLPLPKFGASELIVVSPVKIDPAAETSINLPPLLTMPHGGPHSTLTTEWSVGTAIYALAGYRVALVNYPGSLGYGQAFVDELPPRLGHLEVEATLAAGHYLNALSLASRTKGKKLIAGGSHGGFITAHLTARFADEFDAALMRNPVTDLMAELQSTDIPDWVIAETANEYSFQHPPTHVSNELYAHMAQASPMTFVDQVTCPTMLMIGASDRRVPHDQGRAWYHALKNRGQAPVDMLVFPGNGHPLDSTVECEVDEMSNDRSESWYRPQSLSKTPLSPVTPPVARSPSPTKRPVSMLADLQHYATTNVPPRSPTMSFVSQTMEPMTGTGNGGLHRRGTASMSSLNLRRQLSVHSISSPVGGDNTDAAGLQSSPTLTRMSPLKDQGTSSQTLARGPSVSRLTRSTSTSTWQSTSSPFASVHGSKHRTAVGAVHEDMQNKVFCKWLNARLTPRFEPVTDLGKDFQDGTRLIQLVEVLTEQSLGRYNRDPNHRVQKFENARHALERIKQMGVHLTNIGPEDIVDGNRKLILGMIWSLVLRFTIADIEEEGTHAKEGLLLWCQRRTEPYPEVNIENFSKSFQDGLAFCALIHRHRPELLDWDLLSKDAAHAEANIQLAFDVAEKHLGIPQLLEVSDVNGRRPDEKLIMTYVAQYFHAFSSKAQNETDAKVISSFADNMSSLMLALHDYEQRTELLLASVDREASVWDSIDTAHLDFEAVAQLKNKLIRYRAETKVELGSERLALQELLVNIRTKLETYGLRDYEPEDRLSPQNVESVWYTCEDKEAKHANDLHGMTLRWRQAAAKHFAEQADALFSLLETASQTLAGLNGSLDSQLADTLRIVSGEQQWRAMLEEVHKADSMCQAYSVEHNEHTVRSASGLAHAVEHLVSRCNNRRNFIQNQMVARRKTDVSARDLEDFDSAFRSFDKDGVGSLTVDQLAGALGALGVVEIDLEEIHAQVGDVVNYDEFIQFMVSRKEMRPTSDKVQTCFRSAAGGKPYITELDLRKLSLPTRALEFLVDKMELYVPPDDGIDIVAPAEEDGDAFDYEAFIERFSIL